MARDPPLIPQQCEEEEEAPFFVHMFPGAGTLCVGCIAERDLLELRRRRTVQCYVLHT